MLEYTKTILRKVSFDSELFTKELKKSLKWLNEEDINNLYLWLVENYYHSHKSIINEMFKDIHANVAS